METPDNAGLVPPSGGYRPPVFQQPQRGAATATCSVTTAASPPPPPSWPPVEPSTCVRSSPPSTTQRAMPIQNASSAPSRRTSSGLATGSASSSSMLPSLIGSTPGTTVFLNSLRHHPQTQHESSHLQQAVLSSVSGRNTPTPRIFLDSRWADCESLILMEDSQTRYVKRIVHVVADKLCSIRGRQRQAE